jgi:shikimate dehydrogenase/3-dehydroquinate dehydratase type I
MAICVSVRSATVKEAAAAVSVAQEKGADLVEVRFDLMSSPPTDLAPLKTAPLPKMATLRSKAHGGEWEGKDEDRLRLYRRAARAGFSLIDLEIDSPLLGFRDRDLKKVEVVVSHHDHEGTPPTSRIIEIMLLAGARGDLAKGAFKVNTVSELHRLVHASKLLSLTGKKFVLLGMGPLGPITRLRYRRLGSSMTYASLEPGKETAQGQVDIASLKKLENGIITGIAGMPLGHSFSPSMHRAAFEAMGIAGTYLPFPAQREELPLLMELMRDLDIAGLNVTIPHKETVMEHLDRLDGNAEDVGAVNVIVNQKGRLIGKNTDVSGLAQAFKAAGVDVRGKRSLIVGAGGAARACAAFLRRDGANIVVANRTRSRAEEVARRFSGEAVGLDDVKGMDFDVVVNCTPLGMKGFPSQLPIDPEVFHPGQVAMDVIYNPERTPFLTEAEARGCKIIPGREMLIYQAMDAFEAWTGQRPPYEILAEAVRKEQE